MTGQKRITGVIAALTAAATFGMIPLFSIPLMANGISEFSVLFYRCLFSGIAIAGVCAAMRRSLRIPLPVLLRLLIMSLIYSTTATGLMYAYRYISSGVVTTLHFLYPVIVALLMGILYKEKISMKLIVASVFTLAGVGMLSWSGDGFLNATGILLAIGTAFSYAFYIVALKQKGIRDTDGMVIIFYIMLFCTAIFGILGLATTGIQPVPNGESWVNVLLLALVPTIISNLALVKAVNCVGATVTSILGSAEPLTAVLIGAAVFSEELGLSGIIGLLVITASVSYVILAESRRKRRPQTEPGVPQAVGLTDRGPLVSQRLIRK